MEQQQKTQAMGFVRAFYENLKISIFIIKKDGTIRYANKMGQNTFNGFGVTIEQGMNLYSYIKKKGFNVYEIISPENQRTVRYNYYKVYFSIVRFNDKEYYLVQLINNDIPLIDGLTRLPNKQAFVKETEKTLTACFIDGTLSLVMTIDLLNFSDIKRAYKDKTADKVLQEVSRRLRALKDTYPALYLARIGNKAHFLALVSIKKDEVESIQAIPEALYRAINNEPIVIGNEKIYLNSRIGISFSFDAPEADRLVSYSTDALKASNSKWIPGTNIYCYDYEKVQQEIKRITTVNKLHHAIHIGDITFFYQPKVELATGNVDNVEALIRWKQGNRIVTPKEFLKEAANDEVMKKISRATIEYTVSDAKWWHGKGYPIRVGVNLSPKQLEDDVLLAFIMETMKKYNFPFEYIEFEITEKGYINNQKSIIKLIDDIKKSKFSIAIDDFGAVNSLQNLIDIPRGAINTIKIDKLFIDRLSPTKDAGAHNPARSAIELIIGLSRQMGCRTVAEGVDDTPEGYVKYQMLKNMGIDYIQGFLFYRPLSASGYTKLLENGPKPISEIEKKFKEKYE